MGGKYKAGQEVTPIVNSNGGREAGVYGRTVGVFSTDTDDSHMVRGTRGGCGFRCNRLVLGWVWGWVRG